MGRMILITPRAARTYIHKIILDKWPCWHDTCLPPPKKNDFYCCNLRLTQACFCPCREVPAVTEKLK